jgi:hypothetical protein
VRLSSVHTNQLDDPTTGLDGLNCTCAAGAAAVKWRYRNRRPTPDPEFLWPPTGGYVRALCREDDGSADTEGGTNLLQVQSAVRRGWDVPMVVVANGDFDEAWAQARDPDNLVIFQFQYSVIHGTQWACSETFMGAHAASGANALADRISWSDPLADGRRKGIPDGVQSMERHVLREACGKLVVDPRTKRQRGLGRANYAVVAALPEPEPVTDSGDVMFNVGPTSTYRDAVLKAGTVLYRDAALTTRHSAVKNETPLGFMGSTATAHVVVNAGRSNYVRRDDVARIVINERQFE